MPSLLRYLFATAVLLSMSAVAAAQAGRYIPIPVRPPGGLPIGPHVPFHFGGDSDVIMYIILGALGVGGVLWLVGVIVEGLADKGASGTIKWSSGGSIPDVIHEASAVAPKATRTRLLMGFLARQDSLLDPTALLRWTEESFLRVQQCWQERD